MSNVLLPLRAALRDRYLNLLQKLCRVELRKIADKHPMTRKELVKYHDFMAINCLESSAKNADRILGVSVATANALDAPPRPLQQPNGVNRGEY